ncbi:hypothetical protein EYC80_000259 [Monilinia laxa]|uniref:Uncharacterized protein n=1 Tax=Monilinia laxa TaxID=61186 RepID=A0A5N6KA07_MONLA|nr:hypothetical protein EYC80_000259 [Monilinia laxa]
MNLFLHFTLASCPILLLRYGSGKVIYALVATFRSDFFFIAFFAKQTIFLYWKYFNQKTCTHRLLLCSTTLALLDGGTFFLFLVENYLPFTQDYNIFARCG